MGIYVIFRNISRNSRYLYNALEKSHNMASDVYMYIAGSYSNFWRKNYSVYDKKRADMSDTNCTTNGNHVQNSDSKTDQHDEELYLEAVQRVIDHGRRKSNRTGIDTLSTFGMQMRSELFVFNLYYFDFVSYVYTH